MKEQVRSVDRILDLLEILSLERGSIGLTELSERTGLSKSTAHRLMNTLCTRGYAEKTPSSRYLLGPKLIELSSYYIENLELLTVARPFLADLYSELKLTVYMGKLHGNKVLYTELVDQTIVSKSNESGIGVPAYTSSIGKCLLASLSGSELDDILYDNPLVKYTENTIVDVAEYKKHLKEVRSRGWAMDDEEYLLGRRCVGVPVYDYVGNAIACVSVSGSTAEISDDKLDTIIYSVKETAGAISRRMGYIP